MKKNQVVIDCFLCDPAKCPIAAQCGVNDRKVLAAANVENRVQTLEDNMEYVLEELRTHRCQLGDLRKGENR